MAPSKTAMPVVLGTMTMGAPNVEGVRISSIPDIKNMFNNFLSHGHSELDNARLYGGGSSEEYMAQADWQSFDLVMGTKLYPNEGKAMKMGTNVYSHRPEDVRRGLLESLKALGTEKVDLWYLHGPDRKTPLEDTLREVNNLYKEGRFNRFGISNYMSWEVAAICEICTRNNWIQPTVYQGIYNALHRGIEAELIPCLRKYNIALYAFQPLAGGFLTSRYKRNMSESDYEPGSRFDPKRWQGQLHHGRYINDTYFDALDVIRPVLQEKGLTEAEAALRWLVHHSLMEEGKGDKIIIGASSVEQLEGNLVDLEKGALDKEVVDALEAGWLRVKGVVPKYFH